MTAADQICTRCRAVLTPSALARDDGKCGPCRRGCSHPLTPNPVLAAQGFHRIGRLDSVGRRSLWLREERGAFELRAGREGDDACVRVTSDHPLYRELATVLAAARWAAEWEQSDGMALEESFELDVCPASINRVDL